MDAQLSLFEKANCNSLVYCSSVGPVFQPLFEAAGHVRKIEGLGLEEVLAEEPVRHYSYDLPFEHTSNLPFATLHSSGSSGNPKPISWNKPFLAGLDSANIVPEDQGLHLTRSFARHQELLVLLPLFHVSFSPCCC